jgi:hypothetical protein
MDSRRKDDVGRPLKAALEKLCRNATTAATTTNGMNGNNLVLRLYNFFSPSLTAMLTSFKQGNVGLPGTNSLNYFPTVSVRKKKFYNTDY